MPLDQPQKLTERRINLDNPQPLTFSQPAFRLEQLEITVEMAAEILSANKHREESTWAVKTVGYFSAGKPASLLVSVESRAVVLEPFEAIAIAKAYVESAIR